MLKLSFIAVLLTIQVTILASGVHINVESKFLKKPFTGRVYVVIAPQSDKTQPLQTQYWFSPVEIIAKEVKGWTGKEPIIISSDDIRYIKKSSNQNVKYDLQVLLRINTRDASPFESLNNIYSSTITLSDEQHEKLNINVIADKVITAVSPLAIKRPPASEKLIYNSFHSKLLSEFHQQPYFVNMAIRLPKNFQQEPNKTWPVLYSISGMGGSEVSFLKLTRKREQYFDNMITVSVDAMNYGGHSVFADSANTGPWASILIKEIAPYIDENYRGRGAKERYLTGVSSGGWSSLWLQVKYPTDFAGTWTFVPDPVDFRDFQRINLYADNQNIFTNNLGEDRLVARTSKGMPLIKNREFISLEYALGEGGQIRSFEYVFSPKDENNLPIPFFDRRTGHINSDVLKAWKKYDIRLYLKSNWPFIKDDLKGKLHVYAGEKDNFFLEGAVRLLKEQMISLGAKEDIRIIEGMSHSFDNDVLIEMLKTIASNAEK